MIIHFNGMPGVGKLTIATLLAKKINARVLDNHLIIDLVLAVCERGSPQYLAMIGKINAVVLEQIAETPRKNFIFTNALAAELAEDRKRFEQIRTFAENQNIPFVQIFLNCDLAENKRRVVSKSRRSKGKLLNPDELENLYENYTIYHPSHKFSLEIETTNLPPASVSEQIEDYLKKIKVP